MKIIRQKKTFLSVYIIMYFAGLIYIVYIFTSTKDMFEPVILMTICFIFLIAMIAHALIDHLKKFRLTFLIKFEDDHLIYNEYNKRVNSKIKYREIRSVERTYDGKYLELKFVDMQKKSILILMEDINEDISVVEQEFNGKLE